VNNFFQVVFIFIDFADQETLSHDHVVVVVTEARNLASCKKKHYKKHSKKLFKKNLLSMKKWLILANLPSQALV